MNDNAAADTIAIYAMLAYTCIAASCSSPQTAEINADKRAGTLMKWVRIGVAQIILFAAIGVYFDGKNGKNWWPAALGAASGQCCSTRNTNTRSVQA